MKTLKACKPQKLDYAMLRKELTLPLICIYEKPKDYPSGYVARVFDLNRPTLLYWTGDTITRVRDAIPPEMHRIPRSQGDDPAIRETWI